MPFVLVGNANNSVPVFSIVGLQFASGGEGVASSFKNLTNHGVSAVSISGFNVTLSFNFTNWGNLYGFCPGGYFERVWGS